MIYLESSALVKRYVEEPGSDAVDRLLAEHRHAAISRLGYPEILSALNRKRGMKELSARALGKLIAAFEADWAKLFVLEFDEELLPGIKDAILRHSLRGADAVHLVTAMWLRSVLKEDVVFACADAKLLAAAQRERLIAFDPGG
ncbi:MAG: type II toxin-antitoxin system VapC family toxin [Thermodesulfobacteriota bacterium]